MSHTADRPRFFVLGAGFSAPAGLPTSVELLDLVFAELARVGHDGHLRGSLDEYLEYVTDTRGSRPGEVDIEEFAAYLDYEHLFRMLGSDTWSDDGNRAQLQLRWGIGRVLHRRTPPTWNLPAMYLEFAAHLRPRDVVVTFNYDRILEKALDHVGTPYRRFPNRYLEVGAYFSSTDFKAEARDVLVVKVHGSIDWVSMETFRREQEWYRAVGDTMTADLHRRHDPLLGGNPVSVMHQLIEGLRRPDDPLNDVNVIDDLDAYYAQPEVLYYHPPLVLAPSAAKQFYGRPLVEMWSGIGTWGWLWSGLTFIGYSFPPADPYARQAVYGLVRGYARGLEEPTLRLGPMRPIDVVSLKRTPEAVQDLHETYRFVPTKHANFITSGFDSDAVRELFA